MGRGFNAHPLNPSALASFGDAYRVALADVRNDPKHAADYAWPVCECGIVVADRMLAAIERGTYNHDSPAFRLTCKRLGIKGSRKAIEAFLAGQ